MGFIDDSNNVIYYIRELINQGKLRFDYLKGEKVFPLEAKLAKEAIEENDIIQRRIEQANFEEKLKIDKLMDCA